MNLGAFLIDKQTESERDIIKTKQTNFFQEVKEVKMPNVNVLRSELFTKIGREFSKLSPRN